VLLTHNAYHRIGRASSIFRPASSASAKGRDRSCIAKPVERIGNGVCPVMAKVLVEADYVPDYVLAMSRN
jgi:hypothetical protein